MSEKRDLYDKNKNKTGKTIEKGEIVPKDYYYITVVVWIQNTKGQFLIQKTVPKKTSYVGYHWWTS